MNNFCSVCSPKTRLKNIEADVEASKNTTHTGLYSDTGTLARSLFQTWIILDQSLRIREYAY